MKTFTRLNNKTGTLINRSGTWDPLALTVNSELRGLFHTTRGITRCFTCQNIMHVCFYQKFLYIETKIWLYNKGCFQKQCDRYIPQDVDSQAPPLLFWEVHTPSCSLALQMNVSVRRNASPKQRPHWSCTKYGPQSHSEQWRTSNTIVQLGYLSSNPS